MTDPTAPDDGIDLMTDRPHTARIYDFYLGGKTNYAADRAVGESVISLYPIIRTVARANRTFMHRAIRALAAEHGIRQFLDIGTGIPTEPNLHEIAQSVAPTSRVVYVDNDPIVLAHARALLVGDRRGRTEYINADVREPGSIIESPELHDTLDLSEPVALTLFSVLHFVEDEDAYPAVQQLMDILPAGSFLALTAATTDFHPEIDTRSADLYRDKGIPVRLRTKAETARFFSGLHLLEPGIVQVHKWRPDSDMQATAVCDNEIGVYGGVALKALQTVGDQRL